MKYMYKLQPIIALLNKLWGVKERETEYCEDQSRDRVAHF